MKQGEMYNYLYFLNLYNFIKKSLKNLLWIFNKTELIEYSPLLSHVIALLLVVLNEAETYRVVKILIEDSKKILKNKANSIKWHFAIREEDHLK